ncbi:peptidase domain-containing ABC transporter [Algivirga pacifica]|uniref:Peptidase domain-containing ABC transporter n=1 Tax=Algivirga pacifica TaxID=1162670 RepID=A0ABP9CXN3_9BACT
MKGIRQRDITDCGAACLAYVGTYYNSTFSVAKIRQLAATDQEGTSMLGLQEAAIALGFDAKGVRAEKEVLPDVPCPAIAHVITDKGLHHYVVLCETGVDEVKIMDPAEGRKQTIKREQFENEWTGVLLLVTPSSCYEEVREKQTMTEKVLALLRPHRAVLLQVILGAALYTILGLSTSIYVQKIVDHVLVEENHRLLNLMGTGMLLILVLQFVLGIFKALFVMRTGQKMDADLILGYYRHVLHMPQTFFDRMRVGEITSRLGDAIKIRALINEVGVNMVVNIFIVLFSIIVMTVYAWKLTLMVVMVLPLMIAIYLVVNYFNRKIHRAVMEQSAMLQTQLVESLNIAGTMKSFGMEDFFSLKTELQFTGVLKVLYQAAKIGILSENTTRAINLLTTIGILWAGANMVLSHEMTAGELLSFHALLAYLMGPLVQLIGMNQSIQEARIAADRLFEVMQLDTEPLREGQEVLPEMLGDIVFDKVSFRYGARSNVFSDLSLRIPKGKYTAIVGDSGSGKSSIVSLLQGLYPIQKGVIRLGGYNLQHVSMKSYREQLGVVPQQVALIAGSVAENIAMGDLHPDTGRMMEVCKQLGMEGFIQSLPQGLNTPLGENGVNLSGGQRQRLAIARALYRDPSIILMDEATSALDTLTEKRIQQGILQLIRKGKTLLVVAHRLSTVRNADHIIVMEKGKVVEEGTHEELLNHRRKYYKLWQEQGGDVFFT